jgi:uncharacterized membrane protein
MMYWDGDWSWGAWLAMSLMMVTFWGIIAWVLIALVRGTRAGSLSRSADEILDERLARGEISVAEFEELQKALRHPRPTV